MTSSAEAPLAARVMQICLSDSWGGLEMYPGRIAPELERQGWAVHGLALAGTPVEAAFRSAGIEPLTCRSSTTALLAAGRVLRYLKRHDIRVLHAHKSGDMRLAALLVSLWPALRLFYTEHMGVKKPKKDLYHRWAYAKARRVFSISAASYAWNRAALPVSDAQLRKLYCGVDLSGFTEALDTERRREIRGGLGLSDEVLAIALPGRVSRSKGHEIWLEGLRRLAQMPGLPAWRGVVIGEASGRDAQPGGFADQLRAQVENAGMAERVVFAGFRDDLPDCLKAVDIACIPSFNEALGLAVVEAMAAGCAVIGSNSGAIPELIGEDRGRTVRPDDPADWADAMAQLLADAQGRARLGRTAAAWVRHRFELGEHVRVLTGYYQDA